MLDKLERKYGKYAIRNLMKYVVMLYILGFFVAMISATRGVDLYSLYFSFDIDMILRGQIWRIVTFLIQPLDTNIFFMLIAVYLYYMIGNSLEANWGSFKFNVFYFSGVLFNILAAVLIYIIILLWTHGALHLSVPISLHYIHLSMFLAFATIYSDVQFLLFFIIPIKVKYLAYVYIAVEIYGVVDVFLNASVVLGVCSLILLMVSLMNFLLFYLTVLKRKGKTPAAARRRRKFTQDYMSGVYGNYSNSGYGQGNGSGGTRRQVITRHKCAVCGRTELDGDDLEFRFCSKCDGNYEYCMEHLYTHTHVVHEQKDN